MLDEFLKEVITIIVGKQAEGIASLLYSNKHVNEFIIAKKLGITINQTRNILYKIADEGLVSSIRKKDKKKGWYTYFWKIEPLKALEFLKGVVLREMEQINNQIRSREVKQFYVCEKCHIEYSEENALAHDFTCQECGAVFVLRDNVPVLKELKRAWSKLNKDLELIDAEIVKESGKLEKIKSKGMKKLHAESKSKALKKKKTLGPSMLKQKQSKKSLKVKPNSPKKTISKKKTPKKIKKPLKR